MITYIMHSRVRLVNVVVGLCQVWFHFHQFEVLRLGYGLTASELLILLVSISFFTVSLQSQKM